MAIPSSLATVHAFYIETDSANQEDLILETLTGDPEYSDVVP